jgi:hypothetical protein
MALLFECDEKAGYHMGAISVDTEALVVSCTIPILSAIQTVVLRWC